MEIFEALVYTVRNVIIDNPTRVSSTSVLHRWVGQMGSWYSGAKHRPGPQLVVCHRQADILQCVGGPAPIFVLSPSSGDRFCTVKFLIRRWKAKGLHWEIILILHTQRGQEDTHYALNTFTLRTDIIICILIQNQEGEVMAICVIASHSSLIIPPIFVRWCNYVHDCDFVFWSVFMNVMLSDNYISFSAWNEGYPNVPEDFTITEKAPTRAFSWLKAATTAFTFKTLLRHYAKWALTPRSLNVKLGP